MKLLLPLFLAALAVAACADEYFPEELLKEFRQRASLSNSYVLLNGFHLCLDDPGEENVVMQRWVSTSYGSSVRELEKNPSSLHKGTARLLAKVGVICLSGADEDG
jgi:hypothetical protein